MSILGLLAIIWGGSIAVALGTAGACRWSPAARRMLFDAQDLRR